MDCAISSRCGMLGTVCDHPPNTRANPHSYRALVPPLLLTHAAPMSSLMVPSLAPTDCLMTSAETKAVTRRPEQSLWLLEQGITALLVCSGLAAWIRSDVSPLR